MRITFTVHTDPQSFEAEDAIENALEDPGLTGDLERSIESDIEGIMGWRDIRVIVERTT